jgi:hypothetical protein
MASKGMYRSEDFLDKSITGIAVIPDSGRSFGNLSFLRHLMQVNGAHAQILARKLLVNGVLRDLPGAMDMIRAEVEHYTTAIVGSRLDAICSQRRAGLVPHDQPKTAKRNRSWH